ncbi:endonuclease/exonuclease/phosphatase family protein [Dictyocaulus viviparus]|uniref:Endonuclease/exonuclease/phosphatase family protein n=1 Tax=Dictyocaulus viviparus TaxID=29172 RepID=A0A0D8Y8T4_DICVI|nr:endonuclease/exonuclease/phosphatase family protein [Dictyocaulus viviparus]
MLLSHKFWATEDFSSESRTSDDFSEAPITVELPNLTDIELLTLEDVMDSEKILLVGGIPYEVIREPSDISTLTCAMKPLVDCPIYPAVDFRQGSLRRFSVSNAEFRCIGDSYIPSATDSGKLLFLVADLGSQAIVRCAVSKFPIDTVGEPLIFENNIKWCQMKKPSECIRLVSYNILADLYLDLSGPQESLFFPYCPKDYQMMQMRYLKVLFESIGSEMLFSKKQKEVTEGSVIAFNSQRFELLFCESYGLASLLENSCCSDLSKVISSSAVSLEIFTSRPTTLQVAVLRDRKFDNIIICGNTHLHHNPKHEHLKVFQAVVAVRQLDRIRQHFSDSNSMKKIGLLFAGDFNSTPDGPVYEILSTGLLPKSSPCWSLDGNLSPDDLVLLPSRRSLINLTGTGCTNHTRYRNVNGEDQGFSGCLDYIWTDLATLHRIAPRPSHELLTRYEAIPSRIAPSDHIPLLCEIEF